VVVDSLKALDPKRPIREADIIALAALLGLTLCSPTDGGLSRDQHPISEPHLGRSTPSGLKLEIEPFANAVPCTEYRDRVGVERCSTGSRSCCEPSASMLSGFGFDFGMTFAPHTAAPEDLKALLRAEAAYAVSACRRAFDKTIGATVWRQPACYPGASPPSRR
jgi:hypothetical protein